MNFINVEKINHKWHLYQNTIFNEFDWSLKGVHILVHIITRGLLKGMYMLVQYAVISNT